MMEQSRRLLWARTTVFRLLACVIVFACLATHGHGAEQASQTSRVKIAAVPSTHPRVYVQAADIAEIRDRIQKAPYRDIWNSIQKDKDYLYRDFVYVIEGNDTAGRAAIEAALKDLYKRDVFADTRHFDSAYHKAACVYDWCYPLLTDEEKQRFIRQFITLPNQENKHGEVRAGRRSRITTCCYSRWRCDTCSADVEETRVPGGTIPGTATGGGHRTRDGMTSRSDLVSAIRRWLSETPGAVPVADWILRKAEVNGRVPKQLTCPVDEKRYAAMVSFFSDRYVRLGHSGTKCRLLFEQWEIETLGQSGWFVSELAAARGRTLRNRQQEREDRASHVGGVLSEHVESEGLPGFVARRELDYLRDRKGRLLTRTIMA